MSVSVRSTSRSAAQLPASLAEIRKSFAAKTVEARPRIAAMPNLIPLDAWDEKDVLRNNGTPVTYGRGKLLYCERDPAEYIYVVESGLAGVYRVSRDGHRQIAAFYCPGDLFGFEFGEGHALSAEAITRVTVRLHKLGAVLKSAARNSALARELWNALAHEQYRDQEHILRLGQPARQRVASFLLEMEDRLPRADDGGLPISRQDMADYLGLTIETVSRSLTQIKGTTAIVMSSSRKIRIRDLHILKQLSAPAD